MSPSDVSSVADDIENFAQTAELFEEDGQVVLDADAFVRRVAARGERLVIIV